MKNIEIKAPAKINIGLNIISKRSDGYHNLSSLFYPIYDLADILIFEPSDKFEFICSVKSIPNNYSNLVVKAKTILENISNKKINVRIKLEKNIPSQAGLGGGSSDAAATLMTLNAIFELGLTQKQLIDLALQLGSDVPFFISAKPAIGTSRGENLDFVNLKIEEPILIINPGINISTKEAFKNILPNNINFDFRSLILDGKLNYEVLKKNVKNDFENYVFEKYPEIERIKSKLYEAGALFSLMSGSGSTVYGIFSDIESAERAKKNLFTHHFRFISTTLH